MTFESLPNEIIIHCFEYFNALDLLNAFDKLNYRFQKLIENIPLCVQFQHENKTIFDKFCNRILLNPQIKRQIYSLQLSDEIDTCGQIEFFLSLFSLNEFRHLRSLTLIDVKLKEMEKLKLMLPSLSNLSYFCYSSMNMNDTLLSAVPLSNLRKLVLGDVCSLLIQKTTFITHLTIGHCSPKDFNKIFEYAPMLKYLNVKRLQEDNWSLMYNLNVTSAQAICLTQLILCIYDIEFNHIEILLKEKTKLKILTLSVVSDDPDIIDDAKRWQNLIFLFLPHLHILKFHFWLTLNNAYGWKCCRCYEELEFQTDFWNKQHNWHSINHQSESGVGQFTIPYIENDCTITSKTYFSYENLSMNKSKLFDNVTKFTLCLDKISDRHFYGIKFSNVKSLELIQTKCVPPEKAESSKDALESIKMIVNLSNLQHLVVLGYNGMELSSILLEILKEASHLSSILIYRIDLVSLIDNDELCKYFNKMITKLDIDEDSWDEDTFDLLKPVWNIFSNLEQLRCRIDKKDDILVLLNRLPKLLNLSIGILEGFTEDIQFWLQENVPELNANFFLDTDNCKLHLWIGKHLS